MQPTLRSLLLVALLGLAFLPASAAAEEPGFNKRLSTFKKALRSKDPKTRGRAFGYLRGATDPGIADAIAGGIRTVERDGDRIRKDQKTQQAIFDKAMEDLRSAQQTFDASSQGPRDTAQYNKRERKIAKARDGAVMRLKNLENDFTRNRAMIQQAVMVLGESLDAMDDEQLAATLATLTPRWLHSKSVDDRMRWVYAVAGVRRPMITDLLHTVIDAEDELAPVRVASMDALAAREDGLMLGKALKMLELPTEKSTFLIAAISVLRRMHDRRAIPALMAFLAREDIKRTREDARKALMSLTGQKHGPYAGPWKKWWDESKDTFVMPDNPNPPGDVAQPGKGKTFYGIQTTSDRILYIVDISGSMDRPQKGDGEAGKTKWEVLKQELLGSVFNLNPTDQFNVIFFNHQVIPWQPNMVDASERNKKQLKDWVSHKDQKPVGGTNLSDSLHWGFALASSATERPILDTIFFLTDGKPTAGRVQDRERMLANFREWNKRTKLTLHTIGVGIEHDRKFMQELARIGDGRYVSTVPVPEIRVDPEELDFGEVKVGHTLKLVLKISNHGNGACKVTRLNFDLGSEHFQLADDHKRPPYKIEKGEAVEVPIVYDARKVGRQEGRMLIHSNDGSDPRLGIRLLGRTVE